MSEEKKPLIIPRNCPALKYVINGFTAIDIRNMAVVGGVGLIAAVISFFKTNNSIIAVAILIFFVGAAIMIWHRDIYTENMIDKIRILQKNKNSDKHFIYVYVDEIKQRMEKIKKEEVNEKFTK